MTSRSVIPFLGQGGIPVPASVTTIALWQSEQLTSGSSLQTWTDAVNGKALIQSVSGNRPLLAADGSNFNSRAVVQCNVANTRYMSTGVLGAPLWAAGAKVWVYSVMRQRAATYTHCFITGNNGAGGIYDMCLAAEPPNMTSFVSGNSQATTVAYNPGITAPHLYASGINSSGQNQLIIDGVNRGTNGTGLSMASCSLISLGAYTPGPGPCSDLSVALLWFLAGKPNASEEAAILTWSRAYYGTP